ncbi:DUF1906 domain-containing protein [Streptomyces sp. NPDC051366]|uniref:DUF1906 domain-containing protein n=1 Tax=Streptomyces sp. NPDC051366 TaxID=3365652 RepID=UPI0037B23910
MNTWMTHSPYRVVGIYIGGRNRGCSQPNLTASWVQQQAAAGWRFMPIYVGVQASQIASPASEGRSAADDAVNQAAALGLGPGALLYYDMEGYDRAKYSGDVLAFLSAWTEQLHARGYNSAVYSSASSGIADLAAHTSDYTMPDVVFTARWNDVANTGDPVLPSWMCGPSASASTSTAERSRRPGVASRSHIDRDYMDVALGGTPARTASTAGVYRSGESVFYVSDKSGNLPGYAGFGASGDVPLTGDWNRDGKDTFGVYRPGTQTFLLTNDNSSVEMESTFGNPGDVPIKGDWNGDGTDKVGVYRPVESDFCGAAKDSDTVICSARFGNPGDQPITGQW